MKLCAGVSDEPRRTYSGRTYCPACHRPCGSKWVVQFYDRGISREQMLGLAFKPEPPIPNGIEMVTRHYPDGTLPRGRLGIPNGKVTTQ